MTVNFSYFQLQSLLTGILFTFDCFKLYASNGMEINFIFLDLALPCHLSLTLQCSRNISILTNRLGITTRTLTTFYTAEAVQHFGIVIL